MQRKDSNNSARNEAHKRIALAIKAGKKQLFKRHREGMPLDSALMKFFIDLTNAPGINEHLDETSTKTESAFRFDNATKQGRPTAMSSDPTAPSGYLFRSWADIVCSDAPQQERQRAFLLIVDEFARSRHDKPRIDALSMEAMKAPIGGDIDEGDKDDKEWAAQEEMIAAWRIEAGLSNAAREIPLEHRSEREVEEEIKRRVDEALSRPYVSPDLWTGSESYKELNETEVTWAIEAIKGASDPGSLYAGLTVLLIEHFAALAFRRKLHKLESQIEDLKSRYFQVAETEGFRARTIATLHDYITDRLSSKVQTYSTELSEHLNYVESERDVNNPPPSANFRRR